MAKHEAGDKLTLLKIFRRDASSYTPKTDGQIGNTRFETLSVLVFF